MLFNGEVRKAHKCRIFRYEDGAWTMQLRHPFKVWDLFLAVEGVFLKLAEKDENLDETFSWTWHASEQHVKSIIDEMGADAFRTW